MVFTWYSQSHIHYFVFDLLVKQGRDVMGLPLEERRKLLHLLRFSSPRIHLVEYHETSAAEILAAVRGLGLEGVIAKRRDSRYEGGKRSGAWVKCRIHQSQEFVIGGYFPGSHGFDSIIVGYYREKDLMYVARTRNGFVPASRRQVFAKLKDKIIPTCPFVNLPETHPARFGRELDAEAMKKAVWLRPEVVAQIEFLEWTGADRLRHSRFVSLREDKRQNGPQDLQPRLARQFFHPRLHLRPHLGHRQRYPYQQILPLDDLKLVIGLVNLPLVFLSHGGSLL